MTHLRAVAPGRRGRYALRQTMPLARSLRAVHRDMLRALADGVPLPDVLDRLCRIVALRVPNAVMTVSAVEAGVLRPLASPGLPPAFSATIAGEAIGPQAGTCGTAAFLGRDVQTPDIAADPGWAAWTAALLQVGLVACWSSPIRGRDGTVIGTFALYFRKRRGPTAQERRLVRSCLDFCRIAIEHDAALRRLELANARFDVALSNLGQGVCFFDAQQRLIVANKRYCEMYELSPADVTPGITLDAIVALRVAAGTGPKMRAEKYLGWRSAVHVDTAASDTEVELANGRIIAIHHQPMPDQGWVATHEDITERRRAEADITHMARHDALTGLPNRLTFSERMDRALAYVVRGQGCALLCLDLDRFKDVNDTLGHPAGDALLRAAAERLLGFVREVDTVTRLGGDEFAVLLVGLDGPDRAAEVAERIVHGFREPFRIEESDMFITASIGIAVALQDGTTPSQLLRSADVALYGAKAGGRDCYRFFEPEMNERRQARLAFERDLREAVETEAFEIAYQPLFDLGTSAITGFEALLRWTHPVRGVVPPAAFIPVAEETGLIVPLGCWTLRRACREAASWPGGVKVAVNVSAAQFRDGAVLRAVQAALGESGLAPGRLELDVTEDMLLRGGPEVVTGLQGLHALGVRIALDDFGTGASSLSYLRTVPFSNIKIDRSFVRELAEHPGAKALVRAIVGLGRSLAMTTTAEGVETEAQRAHLHEEGCGEVQGFLFSHPVDAAAARALLAAG